MIVPIHGIRCGFLPGPQYALHKSVFAKRQSHSLLVKPCLFINHGNISVHKNIASWDVIQAQETASLRFALFMV